MSTSTQRKRDLRYQSTVALLQRVYCKEPRPILSYSKRTLNLSCPKRNKIAWEVCYEPTLFWGTQQMIHPISKAALKARASDRLKELARPKKNFQAVINRPFFVYSIGRPSVIWPVTEMALKAQTSDRIRQLAKPKRTAEENLDPKHYMRYNMGRPSVIWQVSEAAKRYVISDKIAALAQPKGYHETFEPDKEPVELGAVTTDAMQHVATENTAALSLPKERPDGPFFEIGFPEETIWPVSKEALQYEPTETMVKLAEPKLPHPDYLPDREIPWVISEAAKKALPSPRDAELAKPQRRATMDHVQFDPDAFLVKPNALKASCSQRIGELSMPVERN